MPHKQKLSPDEKVNLIRRCVAGELGVHAAGLLAGVAEYTIRRWMSRYETEGAEGFLWLERNRVYSAELKRRAVEEYLSGEGSHQAICKKHKIRDTRQLRKWIKVYNAHGDFKQSGGGSYMRQGRDTSLEERIQIAKECYAAGKNYSEMALKYNVSYQQVRTWTLRYMELIGRGGEEGCLSQVRQSHLYKAIKEHCEESGNAVEEACSALRVSRAAYYRWLSGKKSARAEENEAIAEKIEQIHMESPDKGYRRINDDLCHDHDIHVNDKRVLRICRKKNIKSTIKYSNHGCTRRAKNPQYIAENVLNRNFHAEAPNEKWLTDVTEFKWYEGTDTHKIYLSAILDLYDRRIVSFVISNRNDNPLVFKTFDQAVKANPDAHPIFHSDRGFQYTNRAFHHKLEKAGMTQSMSRVAKCIDNGPMEGFWGILKRERYYGKRFTSKQELIQMISNYISYYNNRRVQHNLGVLTPFEKHNLFLAA